MKAWEKLYSDEDLAEAVKLMDKVSIKSSDGVQFIADVDGFEVKTYIEYNSPSYPSCNCPSDLSCRHEAALVYYLKNHPELYLRSLDFDEVFDLVSNENLKEFLLKEFKNNPDLKTRFFDEFSKSPIDKDFYVNKLNKIFKTGQDREFKYHRIHNLDVMEDELYDFLVTDVSEVLSAGDHDFACDLLIMIAQILNDATVSTYDSWYSLTDRFLENVNVLTFSIYLDLEKLDELYANMGVIEDIF